MNFRLPVWRTKKQLRCKKSTFCPMSVTDSDSYIHTPGLDSSLYLKSMQTEQWRSALVWTNQGHLNEDRWCLWAACHHEKETKCGFGGRRWGPFLYPSSHCVQTAFFPCSRRRSNLDIGLEPVTERNQFTLNVIVESAALLSVQFICLHQQFRFFYIYKRENPVVR